MIIATCFECGEPAIHDHHVVPRVRGGTRTVPLCDPCHAKCHDRKSMGTPTLTKDALATKRRRGERIGGIPYGYRLEADRVHLQEEPSEQAVIARVWQLRGMGLTQRAVVDQLRQEGVVGRTGNPRALAQVQRILKRARAT